MKQDNIDYKFETDSYNYKYKNIRDLAKILGFNPKSIFLIELRDIIDINEYIGDFNNLSDYYYNFLDYCDENDLEEEVNYDYLIQLYVFEDQTIDEVNEYTLQLLKKYNVDIDKVDYVGKYIIAPSLYDKYGETSKGINNHILGFGINVFYNDDTTVVIPFSNID